MNSRFSVNVRYFLLLIGMAFLGCGSGGNSSAHVEGKVTLDGKPLSGGTVTFFPEGGRSASGQIQADGTFTLSTFADRDGAIPGHHKVTVTPGIIGPPQRPDFDSDAPAVAASKVDFPAKYSNPDTSGLEFEVKGGEPNKPVFELQGK